ncbi:branched-chain amino acid ABC transporter ATP-binding protein [Halorarum salinum]|uniref:ABC transporter ATP-binding protein n=1 Tax=Halorarum salinum TaxID=2743089 RepID=A0A7D5QAE2_9EURY|nr:ABC transporter ATP-binding protein [Halobaculum salinum]QLG62357.1 ABC transporter ATP-binding protein [Halobaculum salinum]
MTDAGAGEGVPGGGADEAEPGTGTDGTAAPLLAVRGLDAAVEGFQVTEGVSLTVDRGEAVGLVGRNGAGKTTTFRGIMGLAEVLGGSVEFRGEELTALRPELVPKRGIGYQPEDRKLFSGMSVDENFRLPIWSAGDARGIDDEDAVVEGVYDLLDELDDRRDANVENLSGGQAKMVAIGRALALDPDLLVLDEPLEGLAPIVVEKLKGYIEDINDRGIAVLIAESNVTHVPEIVDRLAVIERGEIVARGDPEAVVDDDELTKLMQGSGRE